MPDALPASGTVHWVGAGLSTGSGLRLLDRVVLWARDPARGQARLDRLGLAADVRAYTPDALAAALAPGDVVVSMLPADRHPQLLALCRDGRAHFACSSYESPAVAAAAGAAAAQGLVVLTESGLDPGLDHLAAHRLVELARAAVGDGPAQVAFTSYCGGLPAEPNAFRYRFSWAPLGVLTALRSPATYVESGRARTVDRPWEATRPLVLDGETFEAYPNRDSTPYVARYGLPPAWRPESFVRGTLRLAGWRDAWAPVFAELAAGDADRIAELAAELAARHPTTEADTDRVVLSVALTVHRDGTSWTGDYLLDRYGDRAESAMARCVSVPLAYGVTEILAGRLAPGLQRPGADPARWLDALAAHGITGRLRADRGTRAPERPDAAQLRSALHPGDERTPRA